jgi:hypothetical protein
MSGAVSITKAALMMIIVVMGYEDSPKKRSTVRKQHPKRTFGNPVAIPQEVRLAGATQQAIAGSRQPHLVMRASP